MSDWPPPWRTPGVDRYLGGYPKPRASRVNCPTCGALAGVFCVAKTGRRRSGWVDSHRARWRAAEQMAASLAVIEAIGKGRLAQ